MKIRRRNVAFVIGHIESMKGFYSSYFDESEMDFWKDFAENHLIGLGDVFIHDDIINYTDRQLAMSKRTKDYDLVIELHFNAFDRTAHGSECFVDEDATITKDTGDYFCLLMNVEFGYRNRGCKKISKGNGHGFLSLMEPDTLLLEPFFGDNSIDCITFKPNIYAKVIHQTIEFYYDLKNK